MYGLSGKDEGRPGTQENVARGDILPLKDRDNQCSIK